eukprot:1572107-Pyramimonas_sp.AAC.1
MQVRKIDGGDTIKGKTSPLKDVMLELGPQAAKPSVVAETRNEVRRTTTISWTQQDTGCAWGSYGI